MDNRFKKVIIGGTFDLLHVGHENLISHAFDLGEHVSIGVTSDKFNKARGKSTYENEELRRKNLENFLRIKNFSKRAKIILINDIFGTSLVDPNIEVMVVTKETIKNAGIVNREREKLGLKKLKIIKLPHLKDESGKIISSSRIRKGEINSDGLIYKNLLLKIADKKLSNDILNKFKAPLGKIVNSSGNIEGNIITVGDVTTKNVLDSGISTKLSVIDQKTRRAPTEIASLIARNDANGYIRVSNPPSVISKKLILEIEKAIRNRKNGQVILVDGEEDLATIPAILLSPFGVKVLYGQPNKGMVEVLVDQEIKERVLGYLGVEVKPQLDG